MHVVACIVKVLFVVVLLPGRADDRQFYMRHLEFRRLVVAVKGGHPAKAGETLVAHYTRNQATEALMFKEDPQTKNLVTVAGGLCVTEDGGTLVVNIVHNTQQANK